MRRAVATLAVPVLACAALTRPAEAVEIVAHPDTEVSSVTRIELSRIFLKRLRTWVDGKSVSPVDQPADSPVREEFSRRVHRRSVINIEVYWKRMIFSGHSLPPKVLRSDEEVLEHIRSTPGAVGYVGDGADTRGVKRITIEE